jgi:hypothetical protein
MNTVTAISVRRSLTKAGKNPELPNGLPGKKRGARRPQPLATKKGPGR